MTVFTLTKNYLIFTLNHYRFVVEVASSTKKRYSLNIKYWTEYFV